MKRGPRHIKKGSKDKIFVLEDTQKPCIKKLIKNKACFKQRLDRNEQKECSKGLEEKIEPIFQCVRKEVKSSEECNSPD